MSTHPNAILLLTLTPNGLARKTMRGILTEAGLDGESDGQISIGGTKYDHLVMESDFDESMQLSAKEGDLLFFDLVTYGYGEQIAWEALESQKNALEEWARGVCERHNCTFKISVTANYW